jgi:ribonuclease P protein component
VLSVAREFTLGKNERLKSRKLIEQLFSEGKSFATGPFRIYYFISVAANNVSSSAFNVQFGTGVSSKNFKRAVDRNKIKRLTREAYRLQKLPLYDKVKEKKIQLNIFFIYTGKELPDFKLAKEKVAVALKKLYNIVDESVAAGS